MSIFVHVVEIGFSVSLFFNAALFIPQAVRIYTKKNAEGISFITFLGFFLFQLLTGLHGLFRHDYVLALGMLLSMITCTSVIAVASYYRLKSKY